MDQKEASDEDQDQDQDQKDPMDQEDLKAGEQDEEAAVEEIEMGQEVNNGGIFVRPVNCDLSDLSDTEGNETDFYIDDSEPADLEGLMVVFDEEETLLQYKHKDYGENLLESEKNELDFNFEEEDSELEFNYEPGISLASLATCACPCLHHHETGHCQQSL